MNPILGMLLLGVGIIAFVAFICWLVLLVEGDHWWLAAGLAGGAVLLGCLVIGVLMEMDDGTPGRHQWDGGTGPATVCHFEDNHRTKLVGKVVVPDDVLVTVCEDAK